jgi:hypothetical protein
MTILNNPTDVIIKVQLGENEKHSLKSSLSSSHSVSCYAYFHTQRESIGDFFSPATTKKLAC